MRKNATFSYSRTDETLRITARGMSNHELREILVGIWAALDDDDKADHIKELTHYLDEKNSRLSEAARAVQLNVKANLVH